MAPADRRAASACCACPLRRTWRWRSSGTAPPWMMSAAKMAATPRAPATVPSPSLSAVPSVWCAPYLPKTEYCGSRCICQDTNSNQIGSVIQALSSQFQRYSLMQHTYCIHLRPPFQHARMPKTTAFSVSCAHFVKALSTACGQCRLSSKLKTGGTQLLNQDAGARSLTIGTRLEEGKLTAELQAIKCSLRAGTNVVTGGAVLRTLLL